MKNNKSPGLDGFTVEFFKFFWIDIGLFILKSLNYGYRTGSLSITQKQGAITCIPKPNKSRCDLKNWRPISLLNVIYKLLGWAYRGLTGGFLLLQNFCVAISVSPHVCFILVLILISMFLR